VSGEPNERAHPAEAPPRRAARRRIPPDPEDRIGEADEPAELGSLRSDHDRGLCRDTIVSEQDGMIEDLDVSVEQPATAQGWLLPALAGLAVAVVLASSFAQLAPIRPASAPSATARVSVLQNIGPAVGFRSLELPRTVATAASRAQFSGVTGLTSVGQSDGFRDRYVVGDGRVLWVIEYPDPSNGMRVAPANGPERAVDVRGMTGQAYPTVSTSMPLVVSWSADGMQYLVGGVGFTTAELLRFAEALR
jgi:hypothetical protein